MKCLILIVVLVSVLVAVTQAEKQVCEPRKTFSDYCNTCVCSEDGLSAECTKMRCDKNVWNHDGTTKITARPDDAIRRYTRATAPRVVGECPDCTCTCSCS